MKNENCQLHTGRVPKQVNPLAPKSDKHLISPYYVSPESHVKVMRKEKMITNLSSSWLLNKFSLLAALGVYREQYGEYLYWY